MAVGQLAIPEMTLSYVIKNVDFVHVYLVRIIGATTLGYTVSSYLHLESNDPGVSTSILLSRAIGGLISLLSMMMDYNKYQTKFNPAFVSFSIFATALVTLGCLVYTFRGSSFGRANLDFSKRLSCHILVHSIISFVWAFNNFGYPDAMLPEGKLQGWKPDGIHFFAFRMFGILGFTLTLQNFMALWYQNDKDQRNQMLGAIIAMALMMLCMGKFGYDTRGKQSEPSCRDIVLICVFLFQFGNLLCGYFGLQWPSKLKFKRN